MEWTPRPAPCPSSPLLWDWDATAGEEESGAKRGKQHQWGGAAGAGEGEARCQVEGCGVELGGAKGYHRKHRVCEAHSTPASATASSAADDRREISFVWNKAPLSDVKPFPYSSWPSNFKHSQVLDVGEKSIKAGSVNGQIHLPKSNVSSYFPTLYHDIDELLPIKGAGASGAASKLDGAPDVRRALSLLSASSWGLTDPVQKTSSLIQFMDANQNSMISPVSSGGNSNSPFSIDGQPWHRSLKWFSSQGTLVALLFRV